MADADHYDIEPVTAPAGRGAAWLFEGFSLFQKNWLEWIGITIILFVLTIVAAIVPFGSFLLNLFIFVFFAGLMLGCRESEQDGDFGVYCLFTGFSEKLGELILLGILYSLGMLVIVILMVMVLFVLIGGLGFIAEIQAGELDNVVQYAMSILTAVLFALLLYLPLIMAFWFTPALMVLGKLNVFEAIKMSFTGCLINIVPFLLYGIVGFILSILASIPLGLGWLIVFPMIVTSIYISYQDIYESRDT